MCGIVAYVGNRDARAILVEGLKRLEYRGYDSSGIAILDGERPPYLARTVGKVAAPEARGSPIVLGIGREESLAASDVAALAQHTDQVVYLEDNEVARLEPGKFSITTLENRAVSRGTTVLEAGLEAMERGEFPHFMLKEIFEQPEAVENALR